MLSNEAVNVHIENPVVLVGVGLIIAAVTWGVISPWFRGKDMKKEREDLVILTFIDGATSIIEDMVSEGVISRDEAIDILYRRLKKCFPVRDLYPSVNLLKEKIQKRLASGTHAPVELPPKPPRKKMFDKAA